MISRVEREVMEILKDSGFGSQDESQLSQERPIVEVGSSINSLNNFTLIKAYERGGGIWVPKGQEERYDEFRDKRGEPIPVATTESAIDLKWNS